MNSSKQEHSNCERASDLMPVPVQRAVVGYTRQDPYGWAASEGTPRLRLAAVFRFKWTIVCFFIALAVPGIAFVMLSVEPTYQARGEIRVRPVIPRLVFPTEDNGMIPLYSSYLNTQVSAILSPTVLGRVLDQEDVKNTTWYRGGDVPVSREGQHGGSRDGSWYSRLLDALRRPSVTPLERLSDDLRVRPRLGTEIIDISMDGRDPRDVATLVNSVLDQYLTFIRETSDSTNDTIYQKIETEHDRLLTDLKGRRNTADKLREQVGTGEPDELIRQMRLRLDESVARLGALRRDRAAADRQADDLWRQVKLDPDAARLVYRKLDAETRITSGGVAAPEDSAAKTSGSEPTPSATDRGGQQLDLAVSILKHATTELARQREDTLAKMRKEPEGEVRRQLETSLVGMEARQRAIDTLHAALCGQSTMTEEQRKAFEEVLNEGTRQEDAAPSTVDSSRYHDDPEWSRLQAALQAARLEEEVAWERFEKVHPRMLELEARASFAEKMRWQREEQLKALWQARTDSPTIQGEGIPTEPEVVGKLLEARRQVNDLRCRELLLKTDVETQRTDFERAFGTAQALARENADIRRTEELYAAVRSRRDEKLMERKVPGAISIQTRAIPPSAPSSDRRRLLIAMTLAGALGAGFAVAVLRSHMSQAIHEPDDLPPAVQAPFLGQLPLVSAKDGAPPEKSPLLMECVRMVRTALLQRLDGKGGSIIQITSAGPGAGKSTLAVMLGRSLAQGGKSVLLVDADLWHPTLAQRFSLGENPGFHESLADRRPDPDTVCETETPGLCVLPAGQLQEGFNPDLMANGFFSACLERWRQRYDIVLLDSSPVLPVAAGRILAQRADGTIMVVREKHCRRTEVAEALRHLEIAGGNLLGAVLIGSGRSGKYGTGYYYAGKYGHDYYQSRTDNGGA